MNSAAAQTQAAQTQAAQTQADRALALALAIVVKIVAVGITTWLMIAFRGGAL